MTTTDKITLTVPKIFWTDHEARELVNEGDAIIWWENARQVRVTLTYEAALELLSDADYYATMNVGFDIDTDYRSICDSAARTVKALAKVGVTRAAAGWSN